MKTTVVAANSIYLRLLAHGPAASQLDAIFAQYFPRFQLEAFPLDGETDLEEECREFLLDPEDSWDIIVLRDAEGRIIGGIHYQVLDIPDGERFQQVVWLEHLWVEEEDTETCPNFTELLRIAKDQAAKLGALLSFTEFNDAAKMPADLALIEPAKGIMTQDDPRAWQRQNLNVLVDSKGGIAAYGQPALVGQSEPGNHLSLGFIGHGLAGTSLAVTEYLGVCYAAHTTILGDEHEEDCDLLNDPTVAAYTEALQNETVLRFEPR